MKKIILLIIIALIFVKPSFAQEATQSAKTEYQLPFPGLLPDNPLYIFKALRDKLIGMFISDPIKKSEFDLLQADKRLSVAIYLFDKGKAKLAEETVSKGVNYFDESLKNAKLGKEQGRPVDPTLLINLDNSSKKHEEVIEDFVVKTNGDIKRGFEKSLKKFLHSTI